MSDPQGEISQNFTPITRAWENAFFAGLALFGNVTEAAQLAEVDRRTVYYARESDKEFAAKWEDALQSYGDTLESEARRRAVEGVEKTVFWRDMPIAKVREYSDTLLAMLLKANKPEKYKERVAQEVTGKNGGAVRIEFEWTDTEKGDNGGHETD